ncbi:MAG: HypC/HybG/HupF family hydrogenase formation chaperone [Cyclobacteriaceae bacterium]|nr:HypC/HybG/HupF family hydrogenase formation chaperone [Cyclobacteriaceae bacterium]
MCLSIPMQIKKIDGDLAIAVSNGLKMQVSIALIENVTLEDYVLVHTGFAIEKIDIERAMEMIENISTADSDTEKL